MRNGMPLLKLLFPWAFNLFVGLGFLAGGGATLLYEPLLSIIFFSIGAISALIGLLGGLSQMRDLLNGRTKIVGFVTAKSVIEKVTDGLGTIEHPIIRVDGAPFDVSHNIYNWVEEGDEVVVTFWRRVEGVVRVVKTGHRSLPEEKPPVQTQQRPHCSEHPELSHEADEHLHSKRVARRTAIETQGSTSGEGDHTTQLEVAAEDKLNAVKSTRRKKKRHRRVN